MGFTFCRPWRAAEASAAGGVPLEGVPLAVLPLVGVLLVGVPPVVLPLVVLPLAGVIRWASPSAARGGRLKHPPPVGAPLEGVPLAVLPLVGVLLVGVHLPAARRGAALFAFRFACRFLAFCA